jgi:hypothetical protein
MRIFVAQMNVLRVSACMLTPLLATYGQESNAPSAANRLQPKAEGSVDVTERSPEDIAAFPSASIPTARTAPFRPTDMSDTTYQAFNDITPCDFAVSDL